MAKNFLNKGFVLIVGGLVVLGISITAGMGYYLSDVLLYRLIPKEKWAKVQPPECSSWMVEYAYANLSAGSPGSNSNPVDFTCAQALVLPSEDSYVRAQDGMNIHYKIYNNSPLANAYSAHPSTIPQESPLFLHVHGVSGNYMHGTRYFKAASRLGMQLVSMDLSNHGMSDTNGKGAAYGCREFASVLAVVGDLEKKFPTRDIFIHSSSMGAMSVANAIPALQAVDVGHHIVAIAFENPITSLRSIVTQSPLKPPVPNFLIDIGLSIADYRSGYNFDTCRPIDNLKNLMIPAAVLQSAQDDLVPVELAREYFDSLPPQLPNLYKVYAKGAHSAVWNGAPQEYEADLNILWQSGLKYRSQAFVSKNP